MLECLVTCNQFCVIEEVSGVVFLLLKVLKFSANLEYYSLLAQERGRGCSLLVSIIASVARSLATVSAYIRRSHQNISLGSLKFVQDQHSIGTTSRNEQYAQRVPEAGKS